MTLGMLWFDNSKSTLAQKIKKATEYYRKKYGRTPDLCLARPSTLEGQAIEQDGIAIRPYRPILPSHIWIGVDNLEVPAPDSTQKADIKHHSAVES